MIKISLISVILVLTISGFSQKLEFFVRLAPQIGEVQRRDFYLDSISNYPPRYFETAGGISGPGANFEIFDGLDDNGDTLTFYDQLKIGKLCTQNYRPLLNINMGVKSKGKVFYEISFGIQFSRVSYDVNSGYFALKGPASFYFRDNWPGGEWINLTPYDSVYTSSNEIAYSKNDVYDHYKIGPKDGMSIQPNLSVGVGYRFTPRDAVFIQTSLWSYGIAAQHELKNVDFGLSVNKYLLALADQVKIGPWQQSGYSNDKVTGYFNRDFFDPTSGSFARLNLSAFVNFKFISSQKSDNRQFNSKEF